MKTNQSLRVTQQAPRGGGLIRLSLDGRGRRDSNPRERV